MLLPITKDVNVAKSAIQSTVLTSLSPWNRYFYQYNPLDELKQIEVPVLSLHGALDKQVLPENQDSIAHTLIQQGNDKHKVIHFPELNHMFQRANTGEINEYSTISETVNEDVIVEIINWLSSI